MGHDTSILIHPHRFTFPDVPSGESVFFFLRDPVTRFISGFYSRLREARPRTYVPWSPDEALAFKYFQTPNQLALALGSRDAEIRSRAEQAMLSIGHVNTTYRKWLIGEEYLKSRQSDIFFIGFQETLSRDFNIFQQLLHLSERVTLPDDDIRTHRTPLQFDKNLDPIALDLLKEWYRDDYRLIACSRALMKSVT